MKQEYLARPWRVHQLAADFELVDAWQFDLGSADRMPVGDRGFDAFLEDVWAVAGTIEQSLLGRMRVWIGDKLGWDSAPPLPIPGCTEQSISERLTPDDVTANRAMPGEPSPLPAAGVKTIYRFEHETLYEVSNRTIHALLHVSWIETPTGARTGVLAVHVKYRGAASRLYMAAIWPARHFVIYPALIARVERRWARQRDAAA